MLGLIRRRPPTADYNLQRTKHAVSYLLIKMGFPLDIFKKDPDKYFILNYAPIFAKLNDFEKILIMQKSKVVEYNKGDSIYRQGEPPSAFYCVISGRVRIFTQPQSAPGGPAHHFPGSGINTGKVTLEYLNCGKYFGMISVLTGEQHSVNAEAANDSKILELTQEDFKIILHKIPKLAIDLSQTLSRRLKKKDYIEKRIFESNIISIFSAVAKTGKSIYAINLALSLKKETARSVILINIAEDERGVYRDFGAQASRENGADALCTVKLDASFPSEDSIKSAICVDSPSGVSIVNVMYESANLSYAARLNAFLTYLTGSYHYIIVDMPALTEEAIFNILNQSDAIHVITGYDRGDLKSLKSLLSYLFKKINYPQEKIKIILNAQEEPLRLSHKEAADILNYNVFAVLPYLKEQYRRPATAAKRIVWESPELEYVRCVRRIARELGDVRVGLALGGGAAFGLAHIGVLKVLEKENMPIDMVAGTSMGGLIAALWTSGLSAEEVERIFLAYNNNRRKTYGLLFDFYIHKMSIARGGKIRKFLERHIGSKTFQDVNIPLRIVACNITKRKEVIYSSGRLVDAVMASIAIPGVFAPTKIDNDLIIDGGIVEPVPIGTLVRMGIKKIIAVNVLPSPDDAIRNYAFKHELREEEKKAAQLKNAWGRLIFRIRSGFYDCLFPNIMDIIVGSIQAMEYVIAESDCQKADILMHPIENGVDWIDFFKVEMLIKKGEEEAVKTLSAIKSVLNE